MEDPSADAHIGVFQGNGRYLEMFKSADTVAKQEGHLVDVNFVEQSRVEALLHTGQLNSKTRLFRFMRDRTGEAVV